MRRWALGALGNADDRSLATLNIRIDHLRDRARRLVILPGDVHQAGRVAVVRGRSITSEWKNRLHWRVDPSSSSPLTAGCVASRATLTLLDAARRAVRFRPATAARRGHAVCELLGLTLDLRGASSCALPADRRFLGSPVLDSLHGGATAGLLECTATLARVAQAAPGRAAYDRLQHRFPAERQVQPAFAHAGAEVRPAHRQRSVDAWQTDRARPIGAGTATFCWPKRRHRGRGSR
jgi:acyl-coenzyme A thioesterase PaaI-like protein